MFKKAERKKAKLRLGLCGPSNSGKTTGALEIATGMGGKVAFIDTERRAHLCANEFEYDLVELDAPYTPERFINCIKEAEIEGYDILIIDSLSHAWAGEGGVLSIADQAGGTFQQGWKTATPKHNKLMDAIITSKIHIICCFRSKTEYVVEPNEKGKMAPRKIGLAPIQRDGMEYEFTLFMDINSDHYARITKDNTKLFDGQVMQIHRDMGVKIMDWLNCGKSLEEIKQEEDKETEELKQEMLNAEDIVSLRQIFSIARDKHPNHTQLFLDLAAKRKLELQEQDKKCVIGLDELPAVEVH